MALILLVVTVSFGHGPESPGAATLEESIDGQTKSCTSLKQQSDARAATRDAQLQPAYSTRSVPRLDPNGRKYIGFHRWCETDSGTHGLQWISDAANTMNDFIVCRYSPGVAAREVYLDFGGGRIEFTNKDGSGKGDVLFLAVYEGNPPATLFKGNEISLGNPAFVKKWTKAEKVSRVQIEPVRLSVRFRSAVKEFTVVLAGVDPWIDTKVIIQIASLKLSPRSLAGR
jgi:hypothetical protein